jgi:uncharacterized protein YihD (DUF1040 family)
MNGTINKDINIKRLNSILVFLETYWDESQDEHLNFFLKGNILKKASIQPHL